MIIVLATFGSLGDLHAFMALGVELKRRGHRCAIASHAFYQPRVESAGLEFRAIRPDYDPSATGFGKELMDRWRGTENILRKALFPHLQQTFDDLTDATRDADLLVNHSIVFAAPLVGDRTGIARVSVILAPLALLSDYDSPHVLPEPWMNRVLDSYPGLRKALFTYMRRKSLGWCEPINRLRTELGRPATAHPLIEGQHSSLLSLALFSRHFAAPNAGWPERLQQTGFLFYDTKKELPLGMQRFLEQGPAPVVFTLGTAAVLNPGNFFRESLEAARAGGFRAVLLAGPHHAGIREANGVFVCDYAPFGELFPRCAAVVHQGGVGTTAQVLRAGRPSLVVPFAHDQPDNAHRVTRLGAGRSLITRRYSARAARMEMVRILSDPRFAANAERLGEAIRSEDGAGAAADLIENAVLGSSKRARLVLV